MTLFIDIEIKINLFLDDLVINSRVMSAGCRLINQYYNHNILFIMIYYYYYCTIGMPGLSGTVPEPIDFRALHEMFFLSLTVKRNCKI